MTNSENLRREFTSDDVELTASILGDAFADDPMLLWLLNDSKLSEDLFRRLSRTLYAPKGIGHIVGDGQGVTQWLPPGADGNIPDSLFLPLMWRGLFTNGFKTIPRMLKVSAMMEKNHPKDPHYYLFAIGVRSGAQGKGFGRKLFEPVLAKCDAEGMPAYLENSKEKNLAFYRTHGFDVMEGGPMFSAPDQPPLWPMWREPKG